VTGEENDRGDNVAKELQIMHALLDAKGRKSSVGKLEAIYPILVGQPRDPIDELYPGTNNFYRDGSAQAIIEGKLVERPSPPTNRRVLLGRPILPHAVYNEDNSTLMPIHIRAEFSSRDH
jgi:hypothetical protein